MTCLIIIQQLQYYCQKRVVQLSRALTKTMATKFAETATLDLLDDPPAGGTETGPVAISFLARQGLGDFSLDTAVLLHTTVQENAKT